MAIDKFGDEELNVKVYDPVTKTPIVTYTNYNEAANKMFLTPKKVRDNCISKKRVFSPLHQIDVALRLVKAEPGQPNK